MKKISKTVLAVGLSVAMFGGMALAQRDDHDRDHGRDKNWKEEGRHDNGRHVGQERRDDRHDNGRHLGQIKQEERANYRRDDNRGYVRELPRERHVVVYRGRTYYYNDGRFYEPRDRGYYVVPPPIGAAVVSLPGVRIAFSFGGMRYYACGDGFYREDRPGYYTVVQPPYGAVVNVLPSGYTIVHEGPSVYYVVGGVRYREEFRQRRRVFVVVR